MPKQEYLTREEVSIHIGRASQHTKRLASICCKMCKVNNPLELLPKLSSILDDLGSMLELLHRGTGSLNKYACKRCNIHYVQQMAKCPRCSSEGKLLNKE
jgi:hypothetical protein